MILEDVLEWPSRQPTILSRQYYLISQINDILHCGSCWSPNIWILGGAERQNGISSFIAICSRLLRFDTSYIVVRFIRLANQNGYLVL